MKQLKRFNPADDDWIRKNFGKLVEKHPGEYIAVASGHFVFGQTRQEVEQKVAKKSKNILPSVMQIPRLESLTCAL